MEVQKKDGKWLKSCPPELTSLMKWALATNPKWKKLAMVLGGFSEVIQETWIRILAKTDDKAILPCAPTTFVINQLRWTIYRLLNKRKRLIQEHEKWQQVCAEKPVYKQTHDNTFDLKMAYETLLAQCENERQRIAVRGRANGLTYKEIGKKLKVTSSRVAQIESRAMRFIQNYILSNQLENKLRILVDLPEWHPPEKIEEPPIFEVGEIETPT